MAKLTERKAIQVYGGEDYVHTVLVSGAGTEQDRFTVMYEDAHGETSVKVLSKEELSKEFPDDFYSILNRVSL